MGASKYGIPTKPTLKFFSHRLKWKVTLTCFWMIGAITVWILLSDIRCPTKNNVRHGEIYICLENSNIVVFLLHPEIWLSIEIWLYIEINYLTGNESLMVSLSFSNIKWERWSMITLFNFFLSLISRSNSWRSIHLFRHKLAFFFKSKYFSYEWSVKLTKCEPRI